MHDNPYPIHALSTILNTGDITHPILLKATCDTLDVCYQKNIVDMTPYEGLPWQDDYVKVGGPELLQIGQLQMCRTILTEPNPIYKLVHIRRSVSGILWHPQATLLWGIIPRLLTCAGGNQYAQYRRISDLEHPSIVKEFMLQSSRVCQIESRYTIQALCRQYELVVGALCDLAMPSETILIYLDQISLAFYLTGVFHTQYQIPSYHRKVINSYYIDMVTVLAKPFIP